LLSLSQHRHRLTEESADGVDEAGSSTQSLLQWWWFVHTHHEKETGREAG